MIGKVSNFPQVVGASVRRFRGRIGLCKQPINLARTKK
jgi:hypothetical protein